ncbi:MAG: hypothetical protein QM676_09120 [Novosphingobium sp.]
MATHYDRRRNRAAARFAIERVIAEYPNVSEAELYRLIAYFRSEASAFDLAAIAANRKIRPQYRALCRDHKVDRLRSGQRTVTAVIAGLLALGALLSLTTS